MVKVYATTLAVATCLLVAWIFLRALAVNIPSWVGVDPEGRLGAGGRRVVAGMMGFGLAGMAAEFSPRDITWPVALVLAVVGAGASAWYAGWIDGRDEAA